MIRFGKNSLKHRKPKYTIMLTNHDLNNRTVNKEDEGLYNILKPYEDKIFDNFDLKIAISSAMGYGLYSDCVLTVKEFLSECKRFVKNNSD